MSLNGKVVALTIIDSDQALQNVEILLENGRSFSCVLQKADLALGDAVDITIAKL